MTTERVARLVEEEAKYNINIGSLDKFEPLMRPTFTVVIKNGTRYDANNLTGCWRDGDSKSMLSFICSGRLVVVTADSVESVTFYPDGVNYCGVCDQSLHNLYRPKAQ